MIGIVILGLGMVMVATIFPVAWHRARSMSEYTSKKVIVSGADVTVKALTRVSGTSVTPSSFAGDLLFDPVQWAQGNIVPLSINQFWPSDTWVHALNMENIQVEDRKFVDDDTWKIEGSTDLEGSLLDLPRDFYEHSYTRPQVNFHQRVYPPMTLRDGVDDEGVFIDDDPQWDSALDTRRFCWGVFHRIRDKLFDPGALAALTPEDAGVIRSMDIYYVTLRRPRSTFRYAKQDPATAPSPYVLTAAPAFVPAPLEPEFDVMFPVPWRVQVQFPVALTLKKYREGGDTPPEFQPTGIPTEIVVPPPDSDASGAVGAMLVQMFPSGAVFIDEITGTIYRVIKRRITGDDAATAFLTLDREVFFEDLDLPPADLRCETCAPVNPAAPAADAEERLRTVWIYPPPIEAARITVQGQGVLLFQGSQPVVDIDVRALKLSPRD